MNAKEAALMLGVHYKTVLNMINDGRLAASKSDSGDWEIKESDLAAREQSIEDKEFSAIYTHMAVKIIEKVHHRSVRAAQEELILAARSIVKQAENPSELDHLAKRLQAALDVYKAAQAFNQTVDSIRKQADAESLTL
ncbi:helix-turn-helix domain-containing protein [Paenibacillus aurantius]|uniref:Helix-turn-helix domain-containing protein n=1 Tax=Paenibacillus aurantius TaxID=2918900 RepID=A0AA96RCL1_9BACL|nr:helix-turn-helix domain-containing protein [Paenibacillus aurantius]WNQ08817.1 helix-turn-helix domain-containing protein [Paenibacillus aurantius]